MPHSSPAADPAAEIPPSHLDIVRSIARLEGRMEGRFNGLDLEVGGIRSDLTDLAGRLAVVESDGKRPVLVAPPPVPPTAERGLKWWAAVIAAVVAILGGLGAAVSAAVRIVTGAYVYLTAPPHP